MIKRHEGYSSSIYKCPAGFRTVGWGHNLDTNHPPKDIDIYLKVNDVITPDMAERLLSIDMKIAENSCGILFPHFNSFSPNRRDALIDFLFNIGLKKARGFKDAVRAINSEDWDMAALEMKNSKWFSQVGDRAVEICNIIQNG